MGFSSRPENIVRCLHALGSTLVDEGVSVSPTAAVQAAQQVLATAAPS
jgi:aspartate aminotransferase-like enzyme